MGGQAGIQPGGHHGCQFAAHEGRAHQQDLRLSGLDQVDDHVGIGFGLVQGQSRGLGGVDPVGAGGDQFPGRLFELVTHQQSFDSNVESIRQQAGFANELKRNGAQTAVVNFSRHPDRTGCV